MDNQCANYNRKYLESYFDYVYHFEAVDDETIDHFIKSFDELSEQELTIVVFRHGLIDGEPKGLQRTAEHFNVDPKVIKDIDVLVVNKLRNSDRSKYIVEKENDQKMLDKRKYFWVHKDYFPIGTSMEDIIEAAVKNKQKK